MVVYERRSSFSFPFFCVVVLSIQGSIMYPGFRALNYHYAYRSRNKRHSFGINYCFGWKKSSHEQVIGIIEMPFGYYQDLVDLRLTHFDYLKDCINLRAES